MMSNNLAWILGTQNSHLTFSIVGILFITIYVSIFVLIISFLFRVVKYFKTAGNEQKLLRLELGKLADEVQQLRRELKETKNS